MTVRLDGARVLIYSHDTFGLGHLRRCRAIAHSLVDHYKGLTVLILSGSPIIGSFDFRARVDFIRVPGVIKLYNGEYTSLGLHIDLEQTLAIRSSIIQHTANTFQPDLFLVDKEPLGLKGEVKSTLQLLRQQGASCVLGLRDVMDEPLLLRREWKRKKVAPALENLYDEIWIYGLEEISDPLERPDGRAIFLAFEVFADRKECGPNRFVIQPCGEPRNAAVVHRMCTRPSWSPQAVDCRVTRDLVQIDRYRCQPQAHRLIRMAMKSFAKFFKTLARA